MEKKKVERFASPKGVAKFPHLTKPQTRIGDKVVDPTYNITLLLEPEDAATVSFVEKITAAHAKGFAEVKAAAAEAAKKSGKKPKVYMDMGVTNMIKDDTNKEGEPTGKLAIKFKAKAEGKRKDNSVWTFKPALLDARGQGLPSDAAIFGGSIVQVSYSIRHAAMETGAFYTSLQLEAVLGHVIKSEYTRSASEYGFVIDQEESQDAFGEQAPVEEVGATPDF
jgi:hypothetical protein